MDNVPVVLLVDQNTMVKSRIRDILSNQKIKILEAYNQQGIQRLLSDYNYKIDLVVSEIEIDSGNDFNGISLIHLIKKVRSSIPVVILTSISKKSVITQCLLEGAADYILKPFEDEYLKEKLLKYINIESLTEQTVLKFNLKNYLESEIYKAKKGKYYFSLLMIQFDSCSGYNAASQKYSFYHFAEPVYKELKSLFWESDLYIQHGFQSHLGFFPFCDQNNTKIIIHKILDKFEEYKNAEPNMSNYSIHHAFATYPTDGKTASDLLHSLAVKKKESTSK